ncbi:MAG: mechanosensitive ion channel family protein [Aquabacterium sp.]|uniref:mechanosensitive ion channel family protein n=1 Tax=Aquabacterium sp. TaxID=1872578 RepID=UPI00271593CA|nr:mechanosensitive ion channel family protein [Aquabacterium sp.]MDO9004311.1 mechanosensitive ion channel family protein [Aquabacterium sp.]
MNILSDWLSRHVGIEPWVASLIAIAIVTIVLNQLAQVLLRQAAKWTANTATAWDEAVVSTARRPILVAMWVVGFSYMARVLQRHVEEPFLAEVQSLRDVALITCVVWFLLRFIGKASRHIIAARLARGEEVDDTTIDALGKLARLVTFVVAVLMVAQTLGFHITGLLALGGVGGIAVGFAAKDILANFFGGLTIYLDRPFSVGDWIRSPDKSIEGTVEYISWRHTRVRAFNKNPIYVPNAVFTTIVVENPSRMSHRRIKETIGLRYEDIDRIEPIVADIRAMLVAHPDIDATQTLIVNFNQFGASSLDLMVYAFTKTVVWVAYQEVKQDVLLKIGRIVAQHGAQVAFPTQTLHFPQP